MLARGRLLILSAASLVLLGAAGLALNLLAGENGDGAASTVGYLVAVGSFGVVGLTLAWRRPENPIGLLMIVNTFVLLFAGLAQAYPAYSLLESPGALPGGNWFALWNEAGWPALFASLIAIAFVFPDGRFAGERWRRLAIIGAAGIGGSILLNLFQPDPLSAPFANVDSPLPQMNASIFWPLSLLSMLGILIGMVGAAFSVRVKFRRSTGIHRLQFRWLVLASLMLPATLIACLGEAAIVGETGAATTVMLILTEVAFALAIGVAVLRYRLYEIDRLINRTLVYLVLSVLLAGAYAGVALGLGVALGSSSAYATSAATLAVVFAFRPLRNRVQLVVDRRFARAKYEGLRTVQSFLAELRAGRMPPEQIGDVLAQALGDPGLELLFHLPGVEGLVDAQGRDVALERSDPRVRTPVRRGELELALILHDGSLQAQVDTLDSVIETAGLAIEVARLRAEVRRRLGEVERSRARIVTASYEERRRLERDLHDGAQQRLVSIGLALRHIQQHAAPGDVIGPELDAPVAELGEAINELRELARGVRPACLDDGLGAALRDLASRAPLATEVDATSDRFPEGLEAAAYFVASEALANSVKHAQASQVRLSAVRRNGTLLVSVRDDGVGGAAAGERSGLSGLSDRVSALGGTLSVNSSARSGTEIVAELPCAS